MKTAQTTSSNPILNLILTDKAVIACTIEGEINIFSRELENIKSVCVHYCFIRYSLWTGKFLFTFGDDCALNKFLIN